MGAKPKAGRSVAETVSKVAGIVVGPYRKVRVEDCVPNDWNMNKVSEATQDKLAAGMRSVMELAGVLAAPIVCRPHPKKTDKYEIIDGEHRWNIACKEKWEEIDAYIINVDTKTAMLLTSTLNYLRGEADPEKKAEYLHRLMTETEMTPDEAALFLPDTASEIVESMESYNLHLDHLSAPDDHGPEDQDDTADQLIELKFAVHRPQAEVIEAELTRIGSLLKGKNIRGRALEFVAVNSSQTPLESLDPGMFEKVPFDEEAAAPAEEPPRIRAKLRRKAS